MSGKKKQQVSTFIANPSKLAKFQTQPPLRSASEHPLYAAGGQNEITVFFTITLCLCVFLSIKKSLLIISYLCC